MVSKHAVHLVLCFALLPTATDGQKQQDETTDHLTARVDKAGPFLVKNNLINSEQAHLVAEIRDFLWHHWREQRPGQLQATFYTAEGDPTNYTFFVERNGKGHWVIRSKAESEVSALLPPGQAPRHESTLRIYSIVERIDSTTEKTVPPNQALSPEVYKLRLRNADKAPPLTI